MWDLTTALKHSITQDKLTASSTYWLSQSPESSGLFKGSLGPGSALGEKRWKKSAWAKKKKIGERSQPRAILGRGKGRQATARLASLADIFSISPRFSPFSHTAEPGPKLIQRTLLLGSWVSPSLVRSRKPLRLQGENMVGWDGQGI